MKTIASLLALSATAGAALAALANAPFVTTTTVAYAVAATAAGGLVALALRDYGRAPRRLVAPARPTIPVFTAVAPAPRRHAYTIRRRPALVERRAA
jgi:hypothetical protein